MDDEYKVVDCPECRGDGWVWVDGPKPWSRARKRTCERCHGAGEIDVPAMDEELREMIG